MHSTLTFGVDDLVIVLVGTAVIVFSSDVELVNGGVLLERVDAWNKEECDW